MTQIVNPSIDRISDSFLTAGSLAYAGLKEGGIFPSGQQTELAKQSAADETVLNGFAFSTSGLDVTVSAGEAFVFGSWIIKDTQTTVTLPTSSTTKLYVGWNKDAANSVIIGRVSDFENEDEKIQIGEFETDSSTVTSETDLREFVSIDAERLQGNETSDITADVSDNGATVVENVGDINVEGGLSASDDGDGSATIVGAPQYTDTDAINAADSESSLSVDISGDANTVDGVNFVENGNSASNIINYDSTNQNIDIGGQDIANLSIDGQQVEEVTINGSVTWKRIIQATGGTTVIDRTINGVDYRIHAFESVGSSTFSVNAAPSGSTVDVLVVAGGGGGGGSDGGSAGGGGAGAGGLVFNQNYSISENSYSITVGSGGNSGSGYSDDSGDDGNNSSAFNITANGGGGGGSRNNSGRNGGCGGGGGSRNNTSGGTGSQGGNGGSAGDTTNGNNPAAGGGGFSQNGESVGNLGSGGDGGDGGDFSSTFTSSFGENGYFAGGGGGGDGGSGGGGVGGIGGGGNMGRNGTNFTGGGGGGTTDEGGSRAGDGGSGIVLIRYEI